MSADMLLEAPSINTLLHTVGAQIPRSAAPVAAPSDPDRRQTPPTAVQLPQRQSASHVYKSFVKRVLRDRTNEAVAASHRGAFPGPKVGDPARTADPAAPGPGLSPWKTGKQRSVLQRIKKLAAGRVVHKRELNARRGVV